MVALHSVADFANCPEGPTWGMSSASHLAGGQVVALQRAADLASSAEGHEP